MKLNNQILNYINELHIKPFKAKDFDTITQRIKDNYLTTSRNSENYFIRNLAHIHNKNTNEPLFDLAKNDIHKNYTAKLYINTLKPIKNANKKNLISIILNILVYIYYFTYTKIIYYYIIKIKFFC